MGRQIDKVVVGGGDSGSCSGGGNISKRMASLNVVGKELLVDGWPKWLTDNIPGDVLAGIVPRSADSYDKLDKVSLFRHFLLQAVPTKSTCSTSIIFFPYF